MSKSPDAFRTISEVAEWLGVQAHVLRFWESKFNQIKPVKRAGGRRYYRPADMRLLGGIKKLLHDDGLTIKGVQKMLREQGVAHVSELSQPIDEPAGASGDLIEGGTVLRFRERDAAPEESGQASFDLGPAMARDWREELTRASDEAARTLGNDGAAPPAEAPAETAAEDGSESGRDAPDPGTLPRFLRGESDLPETADPAPEAAPEPEPPEAEAPEAEAPDTALPEAVFPEAETPEPAAPEEPAPVDLAPEEPAPEDTAPEDAAPETSPAEPPAQDAPGEDDGAAPDPLAPDPLDPDPLAGEAEPDGAATAAAPAETEPAAEPEAEPAAQAAIPDDPPAEQDIAAQPGALAHLTRIDRLPPDLAAEIAPLAQELRAWHDRRAAAAVL